jgi:hypothetical protein
VPLQVTVLPACAPSVTQRATAGIIWERGAPFRLLFSKALLFEGPEFKVQISSALPADPPEEINRRAAAALRGANDLASGMTIDSPISDTTKVRSGTASCD